MDKWGVCVRLFKEPERQVPPLLIVCKVFWVFENSLKSLVLVADSDWFCLSFLAKAGTSGYKEIVVVFPSLLNCPPMVASSVMCIFWTALCMGRFCTRFARLNFFWFSCHSIQNIYFLISLFYQCFLQVQVTRVAIWVQAGQMWGAHSSFLLSLWVIVWTFSCFWCSLGDWWTFRKRTRLLSNFHRSPFHFTSLNKSLRPCRASHRILSWF